MRRFLPISILLHCILCASLSFAQVGITDGTNTGNVSTLKSAFDAINNGTYTGTVVITISGSTTESASAVLNASGNGLANYTSILIKPSGPANITGAIAGHLIDLNGADNVTVNGLNDAGNTLAITNTSAINSSTIRLYNDANNNMITNCTLQGSSTIFGVLYFGSGAVTGNDNNQVYKCDIGPAGTNYPLNGIYSMGTSATIDNSGNIISTNTISDYYNTSSATSGMNINSGNSAWTITNNRLFQTATRVFSAAATHNGIFITSGSGYTITDNIIGYSNAEGTGTTNLVGLTTGSLGGTFPTAYTVGGTANATKYAAINCAFTAGGIPSSIQNNTIAGFALYTSSSTSGTFGVFCGIAVTSGSVDIGTVAGNSIGTASSSIYTACTSSGGAIAGIYVTSSNTVNIQKNVLQNLDAMGTSATTSGSINGINTEGSGGTFLVSGNIIGNETNPNLRLGNLTTGSNLSNTGTTFGTASGTSLFQGIRNAQTGTVTIGEPGSPNIIRNVHVNSTGTLALFRGIYSAAGTTNVSYNTITNLTSVSSGVSYSSGGLAGIGILMVACTNPVVSNNTISGLSITNSGTGGYTLAGIVYNTPNTSITVSKNKISGLSNASTSVSATTPGTATGIFIRDANGASTMIDNNMISLGNGQSTNTTYMGIWAQYNTSAATTLKIYYNSIHIEGTVSSGSQPSMCLQRGDISTTTAYTVYTIDAKNNIFNNIRSGGSGKHYAISNNYPSLSSSATGWPSNASDYNFLSANSSTIGYWSGDQSLASWKTTAACDEHSVTGDPQFVSSADLHIKTYQVSPVSNAGNPIGLITSDIDGDTRTGTPDIGADEYSSTIFSVTFNVDMSTAAGFIPGTDVVYLAGNFPGATWNEPGTNPDLKLTQVGTSLIYSLTMTLSSGSYNYKYFKNSGWNGGEYAGGPDRSVSVSEDKTINDTWGGSIAWANLQWPANGTITVGDEYNVYAQVYIPSGITSAAGAAYGLQCWIGFSTSNTDPSTWNTWIQAPFFGQSYDNDEYKANLGSFISAAGTYYYASRFQFGNMPYVYGGFNGGYWNGTNNVSGVLTVDAPANKTLNVKAFIQGYWNGTAMNQAQDVDMDLNAFNKFAGTTVDTLSVLLAEANTPWAYVFQAHTINVNPDGTMAITVPASFSGSYYIVIKQRNTVETWSANAVDFSGGTISYDFTTSASQAFGSNQKDLNGDGSVWGLYSGDFTSSTAGVKDEFVDFFDLNEIFNLNLSSASGYQAADLTGDGFVDFFDVNLAYNNNLSSIGMNTPPNPAKRPNTGGRNTVK